MVRVRLADAIAAALGRQGPYPGHGAAVRASRAFRAHVERQRRQQREMDDLLVELLGFRPMGVVEIARKLGNGTGAVHVRLARLAAEGRVRTDRTRRPARWVPA